MKKIRLPLYVAVSLCYTDLRAAQERRIIDPVRFSVAASFIGRIRASDKLAPGADLEVNDEFRESLRHCRLHLPISPDIEFKVVDPAAVTATIRMRVVWSEMMSPEGEKPKYRLWIVPAVGALGFDLKLQGEIQSSRPS
jgi:hypothetical protein